jgi:xylulokinase
MDDHPLFLGIDVGTGGVRAMAVARSGEVAAAASAAFDPTLCVEENDRHEQPPSAWWHAACRALGDVLEEIGSPERLAAVAVDGTSGTLVAVDAQGIPLRPALMYNDPRAAAEAEQLNAAAPDFCAKLGYRFAASYALAKIAWLRGHEPAVFRRAARFLHQADYIQEQLTGEPATTDYSNALKTGYDLVEECWPAWMERQLGVVERLPRVVRPGTPVGIVSAAAARQTGLPKGLPVVSGATDGTAAFLASGACNPGDYNTTLGTTLVFKGISERICRRADGLIYSHKLPDGRWLPGAAGNVGCEWIGKFFPGVELRRTDAEAAPRLPTECVAYPLARRGERFPFLREDAEAFFLTEPKDDLDRYAACLQGTALVERLAYEILDEAAGTRGGNVFTTGGGSRSDVWVQCRADVTRRVFHRPRCGQSAFGAAVLAALGTAFDALAEALKAMVRTETAFVPDPSRAERNDDLFERFRRELRKRGWL